MGRVVITHSTYLEGLIPLLKQLAKDPQVVTVTPAVISRVSNGTLRSELWTQHDVFYRLWMRIPA